MVTISDQSLATLVLFAHLGIVLFNVGGLGAIGVPGMTFQAPG